MDVTNQYNDAPPMIGTELPIPYLHDHIKIQSISSIFEIDNEPLIESITYYLKGYRLDKKTKIWIPVDPTNIFKFRRMNELGSEDVSTKLRANISPNALLSDLSLDQIHVLCRNVAYAIIRMVADHYLEYGISPTKANLDHIHHVIMNPIFTALMRAHNGGERLHRERMLKILESSPKGQQEQGDVGMQKQTSSMNPLNIFRRAMQ